MRIVAGRNRGRSLIAPPGNDTRPTADRVRQALFDALLHAPWAGRTAVDGATVLDAFAGTGALGLEALSRGAARATFIENAPAALAALRANIATLRVVEEATVLPADVLRPPKAPSGPAIRSGAPCTLVFLDPPYGAGLAVPALAALAAAGWIAPGAFACIEFGRTEPPPEPPGWTPLYDRTHGAARMIALRRDP